MPRICPYRSSRQQRASGKQGSTGQWQNRSCQGYGPFGTPLQNAEGLSVGESLASGNKGENETKQAKKRTDQTHDAPFESIISHFVPQLILGRLCTCVIQSGRLGCSHYPAGRAVGLAPLQPAAAILTEHSRAPAITSRRLPRDLREHPRRPRSPCRWSCPGLRRSRPCPGYGPRGPYPPGRRRSAHRREPCSWR